MSRQITIGQPPLAASEEPKAVSPLRLRLDAAVAVAVGELILTLALGSWIAYLLTGRVSSAAVRWIGLAGVTIGLVHGSILVILWSTTVASREWIVDDIERGHRMDGEDEDREIRRRLAENAPDVLPEDKAPDYSFVPGLAFAVLHRHFAGLPTTREKCIEAGLCDQAQWNDVNAIFISARMKQNYTLQPGPDLASAWQKWRDQVQVRRHQVWIKTHKGGTRMVLGQ